MTSQLCAITYDPDATTPNTANQNGSPKHKLRRASLRRLLVLAPLLLALPVQAQAACAISRPAKFGVGAWNSYGSWQMAADMKKISAQWYYDWQPGSSSSSNYVPMIWSAQQINYARSTPGSTLLTFNEPDNGYQANMSVSTALRYWPTLMASGKRLSSPAVQTGNEIGSSTWLGQFMAEAERRDYRVDFIAVHYYTTNTSVSSFKRYLTNIYNAYKRPIWVTEWALADWNNTNRFSASQQATFFKQSVEMMDDLSFVERHAWFGLYGNMDGWDINSELVHNRNRTTVGNAYYSEATC